MKIQDLGFDQWFADYSAAFSQEDCRFARISTVDRGSYRLLSESGETPAELAGRISYQIENPSELPCVGDWVTAQYYDNNAAAIIHSVFPRKTFLRRKSPGAKSDFQMIAANIDTAFIVQSCHFDFNPRRLDRYLVMAADGHVEPVVLLTKTDLISQEELDGKIATVNSITKAKVIALSNITGAGFDAFQQMLSPGRTYCLLGSSGVGKTTLINRLLGREAFDTKAVSASGEGVHTTSRRQLIVLEWGALLIDTPGMRELGLIGAGDGLNTGFNEIAALSAQCQYVNCSHEHEPGCAVRAAVEHNALRADRYASYIKLRKESNFYEMSSLDKRKKDKAFGKFLKSVKKQMKD
jgi:ribosome biogenesis GTPase / thiamine phosphate phosphatase